MQRVLEEDHLSLLFYYVQLHLFRHLQDYGAVRQRKNEAEGVIEEERTRQGREGARGNVIVGGYRSWRDTGLPGERKEPELVGLSRFADDGVGSRSLEC